MGYLLLFLISFFLSFLQSESTHFRGAIITWKPTEKGDNSEIDISFRISWRRNAVHTPYNSNQYCDASVVNSNAIFGAQEGQIRCLSNCTGNLGDVGFYCTDFSMSENWASGRRNYTVGLSSHSLSAQTFQFGFTGGDWINSLMHGAANGRWELRVTADLTVRADTGRINFSPISDMPPIVRAQYGCNHSIVIPVSDPDGDFVRCRWAESSKSECEVACGAFPEGHMVSESCIITFGSHVSIGWYALAVQIEDFPSRYSRNSLSSVPLQFLVQIFSTSASCGSIPELVDPTLQDKECIMVPLYTTFTTDVVAKSHTSDGRISEIKTISPPGMAKSSLMAYNYSASEWYVNVSWTPTPSQKGPHIFCFSATDSSGASSQQRCIKLYAGDDRPMVVEGSQYPLFNVTNSNREWHVKFSTQFERPYIQTYIYLYEEGGILRERISVLDGSKVVYPTGSSNKDLTFYTTYHLQEGKRYYFTFGGGIVKGINYCHTGGSYSQSITNSTFWTFTVPYSGSSGAGIESAISVNCDSNGWDIDINLNTVRSLYPGAKESDIYLGENSCSGSSRGNHLLFQQGLRDCLTAEVVSATALKYRNHLVYAMKDPLYPFIIRGHNWTVEVECDVLRNETATGHVSHLNQSTGGQYHHVGSNSHYPVLMAFYRDPSFHYSIPGNPVHAKVGSDIYVKVYTTASDWNVKMRLNSCYAKPTPYAPDRDKYYLIRNGCEDDVNTHIISQATHESKFSFQDFEFTSNQEGFYIYCDATFCEASDYSRQCSQMCNPVGKREATDERPDQETETIYAFIKHDH